MKNMKEAKGSSAFMNKDHPNHLPLMGWVVIKEAEAYVAYSAKDESHEGRDSHC